MRFTAPFRGLPVLVTIVALNLVGAASAAAQARVTLDEARREVSVGDRVSIAAEGGTMTGRVARFGDTDLRLVIDSPRGAVGSRRPIEVTIPLSALRSLERPRDSTKNGALVGAGIGAGSALAMFMYALAVDRNEVDEWGPTYLGIGGVLTGVGALAGWAIDRAHSKRHIRFDPDN